MGPSASVHEVQCTLLDRPILVAGGLSTLGVAAGSSCIWGVAAAIADVACWRVGAQMRLTHTRTASATVVPLRTALATLSG